MRNPEMRVDTFDASVRSHIPQVRTLENMTHEALLRGEMLEVDMYRGVFPGQHSMLEGFRATYDEFRDQTEEIRNPETKTERLVELFRRANELGKNTFAPLSATTGGTVVLEVNEILRRGTYWRAPKIESGSQDELLPPDMGGHPKEFWDVIYNLEALHTEVFDSKRLREPILRMRHLCSGLGYFATGGAVATDALDTLKERWGYDTQYYAERNRMPYKNIIFSNFRAPSLLLQPEAFETKLSLLETASYDKSPIDFATSMSRKFNYEAALRIVCVSYAALCRAGISQDKAIAALYANTDSFRCFTKAVTDVYVSRPSLRGLGHNDQYRTDDDIFLPLYQNIDDITVDHKEEPRLSFAVQDPYPTGAMPDDASTRAIQRFTKKRQTTGRCPMRHSLAPIGGVHKDYISDFNSDIIAEHSVNPHIFMLDGRIDPTALILAMTIQHSERHSLFDVLDARFAKEGLL